MYEFLGRKLDISEEKLKEYEHFMYGPLTDDEAIVYFQMDYGFYPNEEPERFAQYTDEQVTAAILKHMEHGIDVMGATAE